MTSLHAAVQRSNRISIGYLDCRLSILDAHFDENFVRREFLNLIRPHGFLRKFNDEQNIRGKNKQKNIKKIITCHET